MPLKTDTQKCEIIVERRVPTPPLAFQKPRVSHIVILDMLEKEVLQHVGIHHRSIAVDDFKTSIREYDKMGSLGNRAVQLVIIHSFDDADDRSR